MLANLLDMVGVPSSRNGRNYGLAMLVDAIGTGLILPVTVVYLIERLSFSSEDVTASLAAIGLISAFGAPIGGWLADRFGPRPIIVFSLLLAAACFIALIFTSSFNPVMILLSGIYFLDRCSKTAKLVFVAEFAGPDERIILLAFQRSMRNGGYAVGGLFSAIILSLSKENTFSIIFVINSITFLFAAYQVIGINTRQIAKIRKNENGNLLTVLSDKLYILLSLFNLIIVVHTPVILSALPFWISSSIKLDKSIVPILFLINSLGIMLFQPAISRFVKSFKDARLFYGYSIPFFFSSFFCLYIMDSSLPEQARFLVFAAVILLTVGELLSSASELYLSIEMAKPGLTGRYLSVFGLGIEFQRVAGPALIVGSLVVLDDFVWILLAFAVSGACGALMILTKLRDNSQHRPKVSESKI